VACADGLAWCWCRRLHWLAWCTGWPGALALSLAGRWALGGWMAAGGVRGWAEGGSGCSLAGRWLLLLARCAVSVSACEW